MNSKYASTFLLDPEITFLNFGSFGACPRPVFEAYQQWQLKLEQQPVQFIAVKGVEYLQQSRKALADYIHCGQDDLVFVVNPSYAVNIVAKSLNLQPDDEILTTNLEYGACDKTWNFYCKKTGAKYVRQPITLPISDKDTLIEEVKKGLTPKTKVLFISHITSTTGLILPVKELCAWAKSQGLITFVDGAHAPGQIPLDLHTLQADFYTGACHKWMMAPKGCSFLYVHPDLQPLEPLVVSWGYDAATPSNSLFLDYHQMQGTRDFSAFLTIPSCIAFMNAYNWDAEAQRCRALVRENAQRFYTLLNSTALSPLTDDFVAQLLSIRIFTSKPEQLKVLLYEKYKIEIPIMVHEDKVFMRYSIQAFNTQADLDKLYEALSEIIKKTDWIEIPT